MGILEMIKSAMINHPFSSEVQQNACHALQNLAGTKDIDIIYEAKPLNADLINFIDLNFTADVDNRWSMSEFLFMLNGGCIH